jgi:RecB family exonuclease
MPTRLYPASPARLATYEDCPRRYRMAYLDRPPPPKGPPWARTSVGASVHTALARWWALPREERTPRAGGRLLEQAWLPDGFRDAEQSAATLDRARRQVEHYLADLDPDAVPLAVERTVWVRTEVASLWGRVDRVDERGGEAVVVDYKTGRSRLTEDDARTSLALAVYAAAAERTWRRPCARVELHHVPTGEVAAWRHTAESLAAHLDRADALAAELARLDDEHRSGMSRERSDEAFPARVAPRCGLCEFRPVCPPGRSVPQQPSWTGVE